MLFSSFFFRFGIKTLIVLLVFSVILFSSFFFPSLYWTQLEENLLEKFKWQFFIRLSFCLFLIFSFCLLLVSCFLAYLSLLASGKVNSTKGKNKHKQAYIGKKNCSPVFSNPACTCVGGSLGVRAARDCVVLWLNWW